MVRNSTPSRELPDGTPLGYIQQVIFEEQQQRKQFGGTNNYEEEQYDDQYEQQQMQQQQMQQQQMQQQQMQQQQMQQQQMQQQQMQQQKRVDSGAIEPIPAAVPALVTPSIPVNQMNFESINKTTTRVGTTYILFALIFSFIVFVVLYSLPYVQKRQPTRSTLKNLYVSFGIGLVASIVIYFTQNKIINK